LEPEAKKGASTFSELQPAILLVGLLVSAPSRERSKPFAWSSYPPRDQASSTSPGFFKFGRKATEQVTLDGLINTPVPAHRLIIVIKDTELKPCGSLFPPIKLANGAYGSNSSRHIEPVLPRDWEDGNTILYTISGQTFQ
jgi:hypothetical protein